MVVRPLRKSGRRKPAESDLHWFPQKPRRDILAITKNNIKLVICKWTYSTSQPIAGKSCTCATGDQHSDDWVIPEITAQIVIRFPLFFHS